MGEAARQLGVPAFIPLWSSLVAGHLNHRLTVCHVHIFPFCAPTGTVGGSLDRCAAAGDTFARSAQMGTRLWRE
eukprot:2638676-Pleurochrysis_carterae.AAC.1